MGSMGADGARRATSFCRWWTATFKARMWDLYQSAAAAMRTITRIETETETQIRIDRKFGVVKWSTTSPWKTSSAIVFLFSWARCFLMISNWASSWRVPSNSLVELGRVAGFTPHSKWMASGCILNVKSEWMVWFIRCTEQPWGMVIQEVNTIIGQVSYPFCSSHLRKLGYHKLRLYSNILDQHCQSRSTTEYNQPFQNKIVLDIVANLQHIFHSPSLTK